MGRVLQESLTFMKSQEVLDKEKEYAEGYLTSHIAGVQKAYKLYFLPLLKDKNLVLKTVSVDEFKQAIKDAEDNIKEHDKSKWDEPEWSSYRVHYYPTDSEKEFGDDYWHEKEMYYEEAWHHHYENNPHHAEHWYDFNTGEKKEMPLKYIIECICDWISVGWWYKTDTIEWYKNEADKEKSLLHENTKAIIEELLYNVLFK